jgi:hypothetical protein
MCCWTCCAHSHCKHESLPPLVVVHAALRAGREKCSHTKKVPFAGRVRVTHTLTPLRPLAARASTPPVTRRGVCSVALERGRPWGDRSGRSGDHTPVAPPMDGAGPSTGNGAHPAGGARKLVIKAFKGEPSHRLSLLHALFPSPVLRRPAPLHTRLSRDTHACLPSHPAEKPKLPDDFEAVTWGKLRTALVAIAAKVPVASSFEELYRVRSTPGCTCDAAAWRQRGSWRFVRFAAWHKEELLLARALLERGKRSPVTPPHFTCFPPHPSVLRGPVLTQAGAEAVQQRAGRAGQLCGCPCVVPCRRRGRQRTSR